MHVASGFLCVFFLLFAPLLIDDAPSSGRRSFRSIDAKVILLFSRHFEFIASIWSNNVNIISNLFKSDDIYLAVQISVWMKTWKSFICAMRHLKKCHWLPVKNVNSICCENVLKFPSSRFTSFAFCFLVWFAVASMAKKKAEKRKSFVDTRENSSDTKVIGSISFDACHPFWAIENSMETFLVLWCLCFCCIDKCQRHVNEMKLTLFICFCYFVMPMSSSRCFSVTIFFALLFSVTNFDILWIVCTRPKMSRDKSSTKWQWRRRRWRENKT